MSTGNGSLTVRLVIFLEYESCITSTSAFFRLKYLIKNSDTQNHLAREQKIFAWDHENVHLKIMKTCECRNGYCTKFFFEIIAQTQYAMFQKSQKSSFKACTFLLLPGREAAGNHFIHLSLSSNELIHRKKFTKGNSEHNIEISNGAPFSQQPSTTVFNHSPQQLGNLPPSNNKIHKPSTLHQTPHSTLHLKHLSPTQHNNQTPSPTSIQDAWQGRLFKHL